MAGQATTIGEIDGGARWGLIGDPTGGGTMVPLGRLVNVSRTPNLFRQNVKNEVGQTIKTYGTVADHTIEVTMKQKSAAILAAMVAEYTDETTSRSMSTTYGEVAAATLCLVTDEAKINGTPLTDLTTEWYVSVVSTNLGAQVNQIINGDDDQTYTVTFLAQTVTQDQDGQALNEDYRQAFAGDPADAINETTPVPWTLPSVGTW